MVVEFIYSFSDYKDPTNLVELLTNSRLVGFCEEIKLFMCSFRKCASIFNFKRAKLSFRIFFYGKKYSSFLAFLASLALQTPDEQSILIISFINRHL